MTQKNTKIPGRPYFFLDVEWFSLSKAIHLQGKSSSKKTLKKGGDKKKSSVPTKCSERPPFPLILVRPIEITGWLGGVIHPKSQSGSDVLGAIPLGHSLLRRRPDGHQPGAHQPPDGLGDTHGSYETAFYLASFNDHFIVQLNVRFLVHFFRGRFSRPFGRFFIVDSSIQHCNYLVSV